MARRTLPPIRPWQTSRGVAAERLIWAGLGLVLLAALGLGFLPLLRSAPPSTSLPQLGTVPDFRLIERSGRVVTRSDLAGRPWVADFIFTRCGSICPALSGQMARLQHALEEQATEATLVSFTVDPAHDTPPVLSEYAERFRASSGGWLFLTGERKQLHELIGQGFRLAIAERSPAEAGDSGDLITHSDRFVLVDAELRIRGYYRGTEPDTIPQLLRDLARLREAP